MNNSKSLIGPKLYCGVFVAGLLACPVGVTADVFEINTDTMTVRRDGVLWDFGGQLTTAGIINGKATFYLGGDLTLGSGDVLKGVGSRPVSFYVGNDMFVSPTATIDFSAAGSIAGAGGGDGGAGGEGGGVQWVRGGGAFAFFFGAAPPPVPGLDGHTGGGGFAGRAGFVGDDGGEGERGFNNIAPLASGGTTFYDPTTYFNTGTGGAGGEAAKYWPDVLPGFLGGDSKDGGVGFNGTVGSTGGSGAVGGNGAGGQFMADPLNTFDLVAGNGGGGGAGGQGGDGGGGGGGGGGGAAGQGNWATVVVPPLPPTFIPGWNFAGFGGSGGPGSDGGDGGFGGHGGQGGDGGAGAGAVEFLVQGNITLDGSANAIGGHGEAGNAGLGGLQGYAPGEYNEAGNIAAIIPIPGVQTYPGGIVGPGIFPSGVGGIGGVGAYGGEGGQGAAGGIGGGGSGGTIKLVGTSVTGNGQIDLSGGLGGEGGSTADDGQAGRFLVGTNTVANGSSAVGALGSAGLTGSDTTTQDGTLVVNPLIADETFVPTIAGLPTGAEAFGFTGLNANDIMLGASSLIDLTPQEAFAGIARVDLGPGAFGDDYLGYDMLLFFEAKGSQASNPMLGIGEEDYYVPILDGGWSNDILFGGTGDTAVATMNGFDVYATLIPENTEWFNFSIDSGGVILSEKQQILNNGEMFFVTSSPDVPVLDATWIGSSGNWSNAANWSMVFNETGLPPDGTEDPVVADVPSNSAGYAYNIHVDQDVTVNTDITVVVDQLNIGTGDSISIIGGQALTVERFAVRTDSGKINNDGTIMLNGSAGNTARFFVSGPGLMLDGTGILSTTSSTENIIAGLRKGDSLTQFADHTIKAAGMLGNDRLVITNHGEILENGDLTIDPTGDAERSSAAFTSNGVVRADGNNDSITLQDGFFINQTGGLIEAINNADLTFDGARVHNDGTIHVATAASLTITGDGMLTGNDLVLEPGSSFLISSANLANGTHLNNESIVVNNSNIVNIDGGRIGGYVPVYDDWSQFDALGSTITGGTLEGYVSLSLSTIKDVTLTPNAGLDAYNNLGLAGRIDNQGGTSGGDGYFYSYDQTQIVEDTLLTGAGEYNFDRDVNGNGSDVSPRRLTIDQSTTVNFAGIFGQGLVVENYGTLNLVPIDDIAGFDPAGDQNSGFVGLRNAGTITDNFGSLEFFDGIIDNTDGLIDGDFTYFYNTTVIGGTISGATEWSGFGSANYVKDVTFGDPLANGIDITVDNDTVFENVTFTAPTFFTGWTPSDSAVVVFKDQLNLDSPAILNVAGLAVVLDNNFTFDGDGQITLYEASLTSDGVNTHDLNIGPQFTLRADGSSGIPARVSDNGLRVYNQGTITAPDGFTIIDGPGDMFASQPGVINRGQIRGSFLYIEDTYVDNRGGMIGDASGFDEIYLVDARIVGGTVANFVIDSERFEDSGMDFTRLEELTLEGQGLINGGAIVELAGTITNNASVEVDGAVTEFVLDGPVRLDGTGSFIINGEILLTTNSDNDTLTNEAGHTLDFSQSNNIDQFDSSFPQIINHGTIVLGDALFLPVFSSETLPIGAQVPDLSDPINNPDAVMTLTEETTYNVLRTLNNTGTLNGLFIEVQDTAIQNSGTIEVIDMLILTDGSILNDGGIINNSTLFMQGASTLSGGSVSNTFIEVDTTPAVGRAGISSIDMTGSSIEVYGELEFGGNVTGLDSLTIDSASGDVPTIFVENPDTVVEVFATDIFNGQIQLVDGVYRTVTINPINGDALNWTGGTFGLTGQVFAVGPTGISTQIDLTTGKTLEAPLGTSVSAGGTLNLGAGVFDSPTIANDGLVVVGLEDVGGSVDADISGLGLVQKQGSGTVALTGTNTYAGGTTILGGTLEATTSETLGAAAGQVTFAGGNLRITEADTGATPRTLNFTTSTATIDIADEAAVFEVTASNVSTTDLDFTKRGLGTLNHRDDLDLGRGDLRLYDGLLSFDGNFVRMNGTNALPVGAGQGGNHGTSAGRAYIYGGELADTIIQALGGDGGRGGDGNSVNRNGRAGGQGGNGGTLQIYDGKMTIQGPLNLLGGDGGDGGDGDSFFVTFGNGGNGGRGGNGGDINILGGELVFTSSLINLAGGDGGDGGEGAGGFASDGSPGSPGSIGTLRLQGGTLTTMHIHLDSSLYGNFQFTGGTLRFQDNVFNIANSSRLNTVMGATSKTFSGGRSLHVDNTLAAGTVDHRHGGTFNFFGGELKVGTFDGDLTQQGGTNAPGLSPGVMQIVGNYNFNAGDLELELAGLTQGTEFDHLDILGDLTLGNAVLDVFLIDGFTLGVNQWFDIISVAGTLTGQFDGLDELAVVGSFGHLDLRITYTAGDGNDIALFTRPTLPGDIDADGFVGISDLNLVLANWNQNVPPADPLADPTGDGFIGIGDLNFVLANWNAGTPPTVVIPNIPEPATLMLWGSGVTLLHRRRPRCA